MLPLLLAVSGIDPRLDVKATLEAPHLTYAEFGAWVGKTVKAPVSVAPGIAERKMAIFVENRPVGEIMNRVAEALFLEWEPSGSGFSFRLQPKIVQEEALVAAAEDDFERGKFDRDLQQAIHLAKGEDNPLVPALNEARREFESAQGGSEAEVEQARQALESARRSVLLNQAFGDVWNSLDSVERQGLFSGRPVVAAEEALPHNRVLSPRIVSEATEAIGRPVRGLRLTVESFPADHAFVVTLSGNRFMIGGRRPDILRPDTILDRRLDDWSRHLDRSLESIAFSPPGATPSQVPKSGYLSLGDCLASLHRRTKIPLVGDGSRTPVVASAIPQGDRLSGWLNDLNNAGGNLTGKERCLVRTNGGWLMLRTHRYWNQLAGEIPERDLRALEIACARPGGAGLDDYAAFAAHVGSESENVVLGGLLALNASLIPIRYTSNLPFLRLWNALSPAQRAAARTPSGAPVARMSPGQRNLVLLALDTNMAAFDPPDELVAVLIGLSSLPSDLRLFVGDDTDGAATELHQASSRGEAFPLHVGPRLNEGIVASFGRPAHPALVNFVVPMRPLDSAR